MKKTLLITLVVFEAMVANANAQKPARQAGASAAHSDQQGWTPGPPLLPSKKANIHKAASGAKGHSWFGRKKGTTPASTPVDNTKGNPASGASQ